MFAWFFLDSHPTAPQVMHWCMVNDHTITANGQMKGADSLPPILPNTTAIWVLPSSRVLLTEVSLPAGVRANPTTLSFALEDKLIEDPLSVVVQVLETLPNHSFRVAVFSRALLTHIEALAKTLTAGVVPPPILTVDSLLLPHEEKTWGLWFAGENRLLRMGQYAGMVLAKGSEGLMLGWQLSFTMQNNQAPERLVIFGHAEDEEATMKTVRGWGIHLPLSFQPVTALTLFVPDRLVNLLPSRLNPMAWLQQKLSHWGSFALPLAIIGLCWLVIKATIIVKLHIEAGVLTTKIDENFYRVFSREAVKSVSPVDQMAIAYQKQAGKGSGRMSNWLSLVAQALQNTPDNPPISVDYQKGVLSLSFAKPVAQSLIETKFTAANEKVAVRVDGIRLIISELP